MSEMPSMDVDDEVDPFAIPPPVTRGKGRGKGKTTTTTVTRQTLIGDEGGESGERRGMTFAALFDPGPDDENNGEVARVRVHRSEPREGFLGYIEDMEATETFIKERWGGSTYRLEGVSNRGKIVRVRTIVVGGDPIFIGEAFEATWRRQRGLAPARRAGEGNGDAMSTKDMLALIEAREASLRKELADKEERDRKERVEREESRRRDEREFLVQRERDQREWDERRRRDQEESDRRRIQEQEERETRRRRDADESASRQQQFMTQMLAIVQSQASNTIAFVEKTLSGGASRGDPSEMLMKGVSLAMKLREAGEGNGENNEDLLTTVVKNLPDMLNSAGSAIGGAIREVRGGGPTTPKSNATGLTLPAGPVSQKFATLVNRITEAGGNPEATLSQLADRLLASAPPPKVTAPSTSKAQTGPIKTVFDVPVPTQETATAPAATPQSANNAEPAATAAEVVASPKVETEGVVRMAFKKTSPAVLPSPDAPIS